jgi:hypothetical protein
MINPSQSQCKRLGSGETGFASTPRSMLLTPRLGPDPAAAVRSVFVQISV